MASSNVFSRCPRFRCGRLMPCATMRRVGDPGNALKASRLAPACGTGFLILPGRAATRYAALGWRGWRWSEKLLWLSNGKIPECNGPVTLH